MKPVGAIIVTTMNWDDLRYLLAIQRRGTLAGAAQELKVTKATASRRLSALEESVGTRLVERRPTGLVLTPAGLDVVETARHVEGAIASVEERVASSADARPRGLVRLTAPQWVAERLLIPEFPELRLRHAELEVDLIGTNKILNLAQHEADLAIRNVRPTHRSLTARKIGELGGCAYASNAYLDNRGIPASSDAIAGHDVLVYEGLGGIPGFEWMRDADHGARIAFRANDAKALLSAATAGLGLAALPCMLGDLEPALRRVPTLGFSRCEVFLVTHEQVRRTARVRAVSDYVIGIFRRHRALIAG
jgi:DNA-binding transcriptional LysR family regulator